MKIKLFLLSWSFNYEFCLTFVSEYMGPKYKFGFPSKNNNWTLFVWELHLHSNEINDRLECIPPCVRSVVTKPSDLIGSFILHSHPDYIPINICIQSSILSLFIFNQILFVIDISPRWHPTIFLSVKW